MNRPHTPVRVEPARKRIRAYLGGVPVVDTVRPLLVWEHPRFPTYYLPIEDVRQDCLVEEGETARSPSRGNGHLLTVQVGNVVARGAALRFDTSLVPDSAGHVRFDWGAMDAWFEEDEEVFIHPRDPYTRIDILPSSRHVRVEIAGQVIAESTRARFLFETHLPTRFYLPKTDVRMDLLVRSETVTGCPYKGTAEYWSARIGDRLYRDVAWSYRTPLPESQKIAGLIAFWKVDIFVDDVLQEA